MDQEVAKTLGELELKLQALEHELTSVVRRDSGGDAPATPPSSPAAPVNVAAEPPDVQAKPPDAPGKLVDEAVEHGHNWTAEVRETIFGEIPTPSPPAPPSGAPQPPYPPPPVEPPIDMADLVRFKEKLRRTMDELIDEYSELLSRKTSS